LTTSLHGVCLAPERAAARQARASPVVPGDGCRAKTRREQVSPTLHSSGCAPQSLHAQTIHEVPHARFSAMAFGTIRAVACDEVETSLCRRPELGDRVRRSVGGPEYELASDGNEARGRAPGSLEQALVCVEILAHVTLRSEALLGFSPELARVKPPSVVEGGGHLRKVVDDETGAAVIDHFRHRATP
jgi:hypothetical protein